MRTLLVLTVAVTVSVAGQQLPTGFIDEDITSALVTPTGLALLPDGRILLTEQAGTVVVVTPSGASSAIGFVPGVNLLGVERGLLGIAVDPAWASQPYIYVLFTALSQRVHVERYEITGAINDPSSTAIALGLRTLILDALPDAHPLHNGGSLRFGSDGMLYVSLGDDGSPCAAQDPEILAGKILRLDTTAAYGWSGPGPIPPSVLAAPGNPFSGAQSQLVWSLGFRNPWSFAVDYQYGDLYVGDVGQSTWEEIDRVSGGGMNFGWPWMEGSAIAATCSGTMPSLVAPLAVFGNNGGAAIVMFGGIYRDVAASPWSFGPDYEGHLFVADFVQGWVRRLFFDGNSWVSPAAVPGQPNNQDWGAGFTGVTDALVGPDGSIYYTRYAPSSLRRVRRDSGTSCLLSIVSGGQQAGNAGRPLFEPLVVRCSGLGGSPLAGQPVHFGVLSGGGQLEPQPVITDAGGIASSSLIMPESTSASPILVSASTPGSSDTVYFAITWRGLTAFWDPLSRTVSARIHHSEVNIPVTFITHLDSLSTAGPSPYGTVWVNLLMPQSQVFAFDGIGFYGTADPSVLTGPILPQWEFSTTLGFYPGASAVTLIMQGFAVDYSTFPNPLGALVTNPVRLYVY